MSNSTEQPRQAAGDTALLLIDVLNPLDFDGAERVREAALGIVEPLRRLRDAADAAGVPVLYVNDNYGAWHSDRAKLVEHVRQTPGGELVRQLEPRDSDYFVVKPQFSGFYATTLAALLPRLGASRIILTGIAADICVLFTAADAHMREYDLWVPRDTVAGEDEIQTHRALDIMRKSMSAETRSTDDLSLAEWLDR
ncbi:MAG: isochorismatase family cysteine hydrolase [Sphingomonas sp.]